MEKKVLTGWMTKRGTLWKMKVPNRKWKEFDRIEHPDIWLLPRSGYKKVKITIEDG